MTDNLEKAISSAYTSHEKFNVSFPFGIFTKENWKNFLPNATVQILLNPNMLNYKDKRFPHTDYSPKTQEYSYVITTMVVNELFKLFKEEQYFIPLIDIVENMQPFHTFNITKA